MKNKSNLFFAVIAFTFFCCSNAAERIATLNNPTKFVFHKPKTEVTKAIISEFDHFKFAGRALNYKNGELSEPIDSLDIFDQPGNEDDFYLTQSLDVDNVVQSKNYKVNGEFPEYFASFHLHINAIDSMSTEVEIITIDPKIVIGKEFFPSGLHFARLNEYQKVEPSTIEEYEILLKIGAALGEKNMPKLQSN
jgi:hypothetical protein